MDPLWALTAMVEYDWRLWRANTWAANNRERWAFALAAYNGGGAVTGGERTACRSSSGCSPTRYFDHVERFCGATGRSAASCRENRQYPRIILDRWTPAYRAWLKS
jgi:membrane-bound lytic murein transglycosylase MltF